MRRACRADSSVTEQTLLRRRATKLREAVASRLCCIEVDGDVHVSAAEDASHAKLLGAFYTPEMTAASIARWAVRTGKETVLEPSAGNGALVRSVHEQARAILRSPKLSILAFDIDPDAIKNLKDQGLKSTRIVHGDFLKQSSEDFQKVDLVIANPPFNRHHSLEKDTREALKKKFGTSGASGLWAHFILHSLSFLSEGGRIASIVPRSAIFTNHGNALMRRLCENFHNVGIYEFGSRPTWSTHADEAGAVILADGYNLGRSDGYRRGHLLDTGKTMEQAGFESPEYLRICAQTIPLSQVANISIGAVTGRNKVFLLSEDERVRAKIALEDLVPVVSRTRQLQGVFVGKEELCSLSKGGQKTWLLQPKKIGSAVKKYLSVISDDERENVVWFKKRKPWWLVQTGQDYDAVLTYMNDRGLRIALLEKGIVCTNTLHKISFKPDISSDLKMSSILTPITTFGQLAAEKIGRAYGGGVLKFEISEARRLPVLSGISLDEKIIHEIDSALRKGCRDTAQKIADEAFMPIIFGDSWQAAREKLLSELAAMRATRRGLCGKEL
jgi:adenine-specific DNA-methyltransferase